MDTTYWSSSTMDTTIAKLAANLSDKIRYICTAL